MEFNTLHGHPRVALSLAIDPCSFIVAWAGFDAATSQWILAARRFTRDRGTLGGNLLVSAATGPYVSSGIAPVVAADALLNLAIA